MNILVFCFLAATIHNMSDDTDSLSDEDIQEFIKIYKEEFGESLSPKDACEMASRLLELYRVLHPTPLHDEPDREPPKTEKARSLSDSIKKVIDIVSPKKPER